ncbi:hypothetical protein ACIBCD_38735 [Nocardia brasiliensis]|uniref:hypothetical protein n=1 Tax=Nocardia brasiliensis TaxID=37326 RepID=UPI0037AA27DC
MTTPLISDALPTRWPTVARVVALLTAITGVLLVAFAWPSVRSSVHDVPIAVAGPASAVAQFRTALEQRLPGRVRDHRSRRHGRRRKPHP